MLSVMGFVPLDGEWSIVGGTGSFAGARGTIKHNIVPFSPEQNVYELHIHAFYDKPVSEYIIALNSFTLFCIIYNMLRNC